MMIPERLAQAVQLSRQYGYNDEADKLGELESVCEQTPQRTNVEQEITKVAETAIEILSELLNTCELNLDDIEPDTQSKIA